jgi:iron complex transport system ATP-binding protein
VGETVLQASALSIGYRSGRHATRLVASGLDITLRRGELVCLLGPNGTGKSTLLRTLSGLQAPLAGRVLLDNEDVHRMSPSARGRHLSVVLTDRVTAGMMTGYDIVALGRHPHTDWRGTLGKRDHDVIQRALESTDAAALASRQISELSDGERQRVMVARAVAQDPAVMMLDEITAFLDLPRRIEIMRLLATLAHDAGVATVVSTHDLELALRVADRVWLFGREGFVTGAPEDLVLSGAFDRAFASEGVEFDRHLGTFRTATTSRGHVALSGEGVAAIWTTRALERAGYSLSPSDGIPMARVEVRQTAARAEWLLMGDDTVETLATLESLVDSLRAYQASRTHVERRRLQ